MSMAKRIVRYHYFFVAGKEAAATAMLYDYED